MVTRVKEGATKDHGVFCISDFQGYLNKVLLPAWEVPKSTLPYRVRYVDPVETSKYLQVCWSTARSWALAIGASFDKHKKGYYVDNHDRKDVLEHRAVWLGEERELELRQYVWAQLTVAQARKLNVPGYRPSVSAATESAPPVSAATKSAPTLGQKKIERRFRKEPKRTLNVPKEQSEEDKQRQQHIKHEVQKELVYAYTTESGESMVEVHVDILTQKNARIIVNKINNLGNRVRHGRQSECAISRRKNANN